MATTSSRSPSPPPISGLTLSSPPPLQTTWAHTVDPTLPFPEFELLVPELAHPFPFELDIFQKRAVFHIENSQSVFVAAHTSAGKTVVAEYAVAMAIQGGSRYSIEHSSKAIYTSPIKALSNQKFRDFRQTFGEENVGILTGDIQLRPEAPCLIMTTEILRSMLYRGADVVKEVEWVIFDEVHYVNDLDRGVVWEEVIIMLPEHVNLVMLSATVPNTLEFADWVGRTKKKNIYVINTPKRPVPLEHFLFVNGQKELCKIVDQHGAWQSAGYDKAKQFLNPAPKVGGGPGVGRVGDPSRGGNRGGGDGQRGGQGGRGNRGARGLPNGRGNGPDRGSRGGGGSRGSNRGGGHNTTYRGLENIFGNDSDRGKNAMANSDRNLYTSLLAHLKKLELLPVVVFVFSRKRCDALAAGLSTTDFLTASEKSQATAFFDNSLKLLSDDDKEVPQVTRLKETCLRGIGIHHAGVLPILKEIVEILFSKGLIKALFATETFAMGVNMPARAVVFSELSKYDNRGSRDLTPGEYTQMAGRAGRRGKDTTGVVIIAIRDKLPDVATLTTTLLGKPILLVSQFRLTYSMILNLLRVEGIKIEDMLKRSFSENAGQMGLPEKLAKMQKLSQTLNRYMAMPRNRTRDADFDIYANNLQKAETCWHELKKGLQSTTVSNQQKFFHGGRLLIAKVANIPRLCVILKKLQSPNRGFQCLVLTDGAGILQGGQEDDGSVDDYPTYLLAIKPLDMERAGLSHRDIYWEDVQAILEAKVKIDAADAMEPDSPAYANILQEMSAIATASEFISLDVSSKFKDINFVDANSEFKRAMDYAGEFWKANQAEINQHIAGYFNERLIREQLAILKESTSDQNLNLLPEYRQRITVLEDLNFIDKDTHVISLKGRVACEMNTSDELIVTEWLLNNALKELAPEEIVAVMSVFVFQEKVDSDQIYYPQECGVPDALGDLFNHCFKMCEFQFARGVNVSADEYVRELLHPGLVEVVYWWALGRSFKKITDLTEVSEGSIVRCITRLDETIRELSSAAQLIGDTVLFEKMEKASAMIKRDIVFTGSLYI